MSVEEIERYNVLADEIRKSEKEAQGRYERLLILIGVLSDSSAKDSRSQQESQEAAFSRVDERLGAIEKCQDKHRLALESITRILERLTGVRQTRPVSKSSQRRQRRSKR